MFHATCHCRSRDDENTQRQSITKSKQGNKKQKEVETFTLNLYVPKDSFIFVALAVNWLKMNGTSSFKILNIGSFGEKVFPCDIAPS